MKQKRSTTTEREVPETDSVTLNSALLSANLPTLIGVLAHVTRDEKWLSDPFRPHRARGLDDNDNGGFTAEIQDEIRRATADMVAAVNAGTLVPDDPSPSRVAEILSVVLCERVPEEYGPILCEELGIRSRAVALTSPPAREEDLSVGVIGAGRYRRASQPPSRYNSRASPSMS